MDKQVIYAYQSERVTSVVAYDYYLLKSTNKFFNWIWSKLLKYKLIEKHSHPEKYMLNFKKITVDTRKLMDMCKEQIYEYERFNYPKRARKIILGREQQHTLFQEVYDTDGHYTCLDLSKADPTLYGLRLELNPCIDGLVVTGD